MYDNLEILNKWKIKKVLPIDQYFRFWRYLSRHRAISVMSVVESKIVKNGNYFNFFFVDKILFLQLCRFDNGIYDL